jgi:DNA-directed RNA polymerase subunit RPC12/RpoP
MDEVMDCPICTNEVANQTPRDYKGLVIECRRCGSYRVMKSAVARLRALPVPLRLAALSRARKIATGRSLPTISSGCLSFSAGLVK